MGDIFWWSVIEPSITKPMKSLVLHWQRWFHSYVIIQLWGIEIDGQGLNPQFANPWNPWSCRDKDDSLVNKCTESSWFNLDISPLHNCQTVCPRIFSPFLQIQTQICLFRVPVWLYPWTTPLDTVPRLSLWPRSNTFLQQSTIIWYRHQRSKPQVENIQKHTIDSGTSGKIFVEHHILICSPAKTFN